MSGSQTETIVVEDDPTMEVIKKCYIEASVERLKASRKKVKEPTIPGPVKSEGFRTGGASPDIQKCLPSNPQDPDFGRLLIRCLHEDLSEAILYIQVAEAIMVGHKNHVVPPNLADFQWKTEGDVLELFLRAFRAEKRLDIAAKFFGSEAEVERHATGVLFWSFHSQDPYGQQYIQRVLDAARYQYTLLTSQFHMVRMRADLLEHGVQSLPELIFGLTTHLRTP